MVSGLDSGASGPGKTLYSHSASLHPGVCTGELNAGGYPCDGLESHPGGSRHTLSRSMPRKPG